VKINTYWRAKFLTWQFRGKCPTAWQNGLLWDAAMCTSKILVNVHCALTKNVLTNKSTGRW